MLEIITFLSYITHNSSLDASKVSRKEIYCIADAIYHEARGESVEGQTAVAHVILNRVKSKRYPDTACEVVHQPYQFSYEKGKQHANKAAWSASIEYAALSYMGFINDPTDGATHYYAHNKVNPHWSSSYKVAAILGNHTFKRK